MKRESAEKRWAAKYPELGTAPLPVEPCVSPEYFELERERIFKRAWLCVGRIEEITRPGDYVVKEIAVTKSSLIIVHSQAGVIHGFHNVCKHRGNKLAQSCKGRAKGFVCGFHGWVYDTTGKLIHVPDEDQFFDFDKADYPLTPVATDVWEDFIFINLNPQLTETLIDAMAGLGAQLAGFPFEAMEPVGHYTTTVRVNWKVFMAAFMECYHVPILHRKTVPDAATGKGNPLCHLLSVRLHGRNRSCSVYANPDHKPSPAELLAYKYGPTVISGEGAKATIPAGLNPDRHGEWAFDMNGIFPNLIVHVGNGFYYTLVFWPLEVDQTRWDVKLYMSRPQNAGEKISQEFSKILTRDLYREDLSTLENVQAGLMSGALTYLPLSDQELTVRHTFRVVDDAVRTR